MEEFDVTIDYSQIEVFELQSNIALDWNDDHVAQGFRAGTKQIAFGVPDHDGECIVQIQTAGVTEESFEGSERLIRLPFSSSNAGVGIRTVTEQLPVRLPGGDYDVYFGLWPTTDEEGDDAFRIKIGFARQSGAAPKVYRASREMSASPTLVMD